MNLKLQDNSKVKRPVTMIAGAKMSSLLPPPNMLLSRVMLESISRPPSSRSVPSKIEVEEEERQVTSDLSSFDEGNESPVERENVSQGREVKVINKVKLPLSPPPSTTGVYFNNVELRQSVHPLQGEQKRSKARKASGSWIGRPLMPAPSLPKVVGKRQTITKSVAGRKYSQGAKTKILPRPPAMVACQRARYLSNDEKLFVEAATTLAKGNGNVGMRATNAPTKMTTVQ